MKITNKTLLIGFLFGIIFFCIFRDNSFREGLGKKRKREGVVGKIEVAAEAIGTTTAKGLIGLAGVAGKAKNVTNIMGNVFNKEASKGEKKK